MKKIKKVFVFVFALVLIIICDNVNAETYNGKLYDIYHPDSGFTVFAEESNRWMDYNSWIIKSSIDSNIYYCIDPALPLGEAPAGSFSYITGDNNIIGKSNLTKEKYNKVRLLAFYGYGYKNEGVDHTSKKWYGITQVLIWRVMRPDLVWTFKENRNSVPNTNLYKDEVSEINKLVNNHGKVSSFAGVTKNMLIGDSITLTDSNNVLKDYSRVNVPKTVLIKENGNKVTITAIKQGNEEINYSFRNGIINPVALLTSSNYQDIITRGIPSDLPYFQFKVNVTGGVVNLQKIDELSNKNTPQGEATLKDAVYEIYDSNDKKVGEITTDSKGYGKTILDYGKYKLKEVKAPIGYELSDKTYEFEINKDSTNINLEVKDKVISGKVILSKNKGGAGEVMSLEEGASFEVIDSFGKVIDTITTDKNGIAQISLPYGKYSIHQIKGSLGYVYSEDIEIDIKESKIYKVNISNLKLSKLKFIKTDKDTGKRLSNAIIEIYKDDNTLFYTGKTNKEGVLEVSDLEIGKYYIIEKEAPKYYRLNTEKIYFEVSENGKIIKINMQNERKKGTLEFYKIDSVTGERLAGVLVRIVSLEDNKNIFYGRTDKNGKIQINNLNAGKYYIYEEKELRGYLKEEKTILFELVNDNELIRVSMTNQRFIKVPNTLKNEINLIVIGGLLLILLGSSWFIYEKRKK
ncbi:MAG: SpaA isopeptide-forming pilin-related protein [Bacilli bacterium]